MNVILEYCDPALIPRAGFFCASKSRSLEDVQKRGSSVNWIFIEGGLNSIVNVMC